MWCPVFHRMHTASGNHVFPLYSQLKAPNLDYSYVRGRPSEPGLFAKQATEVAAMCDGLGHVASSRNPDCWHEMRTAAVTVPIHEFEHTLLLALDAIGVHKWPVDAAIRLLEGEANGGPDEALAHLNDPDFYRRRRWGVCPPKGASGKEEEGTGVGEEGKRKKKKEEEGGRGKAAVEASAEGDD
jgi:hypothetical protein